jgi:molybdate transport system substrate-binding protein
MRHCATRRVAALLLAAGVILNVLPAAVAQARADQASVTVAVAANFLAILEQLEPDFERRTGHQLTLAAGSTGSLYAQIANGAPYDVFLAADEARPALAVEAGYAVADSEFVYAVGTLLLWSADPDRIRGPEALEGDFHHLAIANPRTAPYGAAAEEVLRALGRWEPLQGRIARTQSIAGTWSTVASRVADLGFVALSSVVLYPGSEGAADIDAAGGPVIATQIPAGSWWQPPQELYAPLRQSAVLLTRGADNPGARAFLRFLAGDEARAAIRRAGYRTP